jgi:hypothetical protein
MGRRSGVTCSKFETGPGKTSLDPYGLLRSAANPGSVGYGRSNAACFRPATHRYQSRFRFPSECRALAAYVICMFYDCMFYDDRGGSVPFVLRASIVTIAPADCDTSVPVAAPYDPCRRFMQAPGPQFQTPRYANADIGVGESADQNAASTWRRNPPSLRSSEHAIANTMGAVKISPGIRRKYHRDNPLFAYRQPSPARRTDRPFVIALRSAGPGSAD